MALIRALPQSGWTIDNDQAYGPCLVWAEADDDAKRIVRSLLTLDPTRRATALSLMWDPFLLACSRQHATTKCDSTGDITANDPRGDVLADDFHPLIKSPSFQDRREFLGTATAAFAAVVANANVANGDLAGGIDLEGPDVGTTTSQTARAADALAALENMASHFVRVITNFDGASMRLTSDGDGGMDGVDDDGGDPILTRWVLHGNGDDGGSGGVEEQEADEYRIVVPVLDAEPTDEASQKTIAVLVLTRPSLLPRPSSQPPTRSKNSGKNAAQVGFWGIALA